MPIKIAIYAGLAATLVLVIGIVENVPNRLAVAVLCACLGLFAQSVGALFVRTARYLHRVLLS